MTPLTPKMYEHTCLVFRNFFEICITLSFDVDFRLKIIKSNLPVCCLPLRESRNNLMVFDISYTH